MRLSQICLMQRFLHIPERPASLRGSQAGVQGGGEGVPQMYNPRGSGRGARCCGGG